MKRLLTLTLAVAVFGAGCAHKKEYASLDRAREIEVVHEGTFIEIPKFKQGEDEIAPASVIGGLNDASEASRGQLEKAGQWQTYASASMAAGAVLLGAGIASEDDTALVTLGAAVGFSLLSLWFTNKAIGSVEDSVDEYNKSIRGGAKTANLSQWLSRDERSPGRTFRILSWTTHF